MKNFWLKTACVALGYLLALALACAAEYIRYLFTQGPAAQAAGGMYAGGDFFLFLGVLGFMSIFPTLLGLYFLRPFGKFWVFFAYGSLLLAFTGPLAEAALKAQQVFQLGQAGWLFWLNPLGIMRILATTVLAPGFALMALVAPQKGPRLILLVSAGIEAALFLFIAALYLGWQRFF